MFETPEGLQHCRAKLIIAIYNLPAREMLLCTKNYNGLSACCFGTHTGITIGDDH
jgi:hypothetical protein